MRLWLVERSHDTRNVVTITYATTDGDRIYRRQATVERLSRSPATAATERDPEAVETVDDPERRERYAEEASRMAETHDPDDEV